LYQKTVDLRNAYYQVFFAAENLHCIDLGCDVF